MSERKENDESPQVDFEGGIPILRTKVSEIERKQAESESRDAEYKDRQITLNTWLVVATITLSITTIALGVVQGCYMHRQWKLNSDGLSKMGDQIWAAKDAALAARQAADTSSHVLAESKEQFGKTLTQMKGQTAAQIGASKAATSAAEAAQKSLLIHERPWLELSKVEIQPAKFIPSHNPIGEPSVAVDLSFLMKNVGVSAATNIYYDMGIVVSQAEGLPPSDKFDKAELDGACQVAENGPSPNSGFTMAMMPTSEQPQSTGAQVNIQRRKIKAIRTLWVSLCVAYEGPVGGKHHTKMLLRFSPVHSASPSIPILPGGSITYVPDSKWGIWSTEAN